MHTLPYWSSCWGDYPNSWDYLPTCWLTTYWGWIGGGGGAGWCMLCMMCKCTLGRRGGGGRDGQRQVCLFVVCEWSNARVDMARGQGCVWDVIRLFAAYISIFILHRRRSDVRQHAIWHTWDTCSFKVSSSKHGHMSLQWTKKTNWELFG